MAWKWKSFSNLRISWFEYFNFPSHVTLVRDGSCLSKLHRPASPHTKNIVIVREFDLRLQWSTNGRDKEKEMLQMFKNCSHYSFFVERDAAARFMSLTCRRLSKISVQWSTKVESLKRHDDSTSSHRRDILFLLLLLAVEKEIQNWGIKHFPIWPRDSSIDQQQQLLLLRCDGAKETLDWALEEREERKKNENDKEVYSPHFNDKYLKPK